ncbi:MAG: futalosine hydrolase [Nitrospirae bacterium]|nr:futalosine hydrolase [Nitrospirota bacterium]
MNALAILTSVPFESNIILSCLKNIRKFRMAGKVVSKGRIAGHDILLMNTGIGKVNAAHAVTALIEHYPLKCVINSGAGGAYPHSVLAVGDIAVASKEIYGDEGVMSPGGWKDLRAIGIPVAQVGKKKYFNEFPLDKKFLKITINILRITHHASRPSPLPPLPMCREGGWGRVKLGNFLTLSSVTGTHKRAIELEKRFNAICENMEGAAIAHVCAMYKIPMLEIRGISNIAGVHDKRKWNLKLASENCQDTVLEIIAGL